MRQTLDNRVAPFTDRVSKFPLSEESLEFTRIREDYRLSGYDLEKTFDGEYHFMYNSTTGRKVRIYLADLHVLDY